MGFGVHTSERGPIARDDPMSHMRRLEAVISKLPEAVRVNVAEWGDHPTFRDHGKNFVFSDPSADHLSFKVTKEEAAAVVATDAAAEPTGYGLGRHGWVSLSVEPDAGEERYTQIAEWVRTSYTLVAPKKLARLVLIEDGLE